MAFYTTEEIEKAREMDLLTYLRQNDPFELVKLSGKTYTTREHDSLKISNGKWMWWSQGIGGKSALDYLVKVKGESFTDAVGMILGNRKIGPSITRPDPAKPIQKKLLLPKKNQNAEKITEYLESRGIDKDIINDCIAKGILYESLPHHNCIFLGRDEEGVERFASFRACTEEKIMGDAAGSDKKYSFRIMRPGKKLHVFESPIDLLSFLTLIKKNGGDWRQNPSLSLGGVFVSGSKYKVPVALENLLEERGDIKEVCLHLDRDFAGKSASKAIEESLKDTHIVKNEPPHFGKDFNDELMIRLQREAERKMNYGRW